MNRLQNPNLELQFEVQIKFQSLNPHQVFRVAKLEHKITPAPFIVAYIEFNRDTTFPDLHYGQIIFYNPYSGLKYTTFFKRTNTYFPLECKTLIRHLNGTNKKFLNNFYIKKTFYLSEDHYFQEK